MYTPPLLCRPGQVPRTVVWLLLVALLLQGGAASLAQVLGRAHTHRPAAVQAGSGPGWLDGLLAWRAARLAELQASAVFRHVDRHAAAHVAGAPARGDAHPHDHDGLERHHHAVGDGSVQALDGASDADGGASGSSSLPWGPASPARGLPAIAAVDSWPSSPALRWSSALTAFPERPPRA